MGEYATYRGQQIKIGTCESMYYLRADQLHLISDSDIKGHEDQVRFRFPFPDEDDIAPGSFEDYNRRIRLDGVRPPDELKDQHYSIQFKHEHGYLCSLPCPEAHDTGNPMRVELPNGVTIARNGFKGSVFLSQQVFHEGMLVPVLECACGMAWRLRTLEDARPVIDSLLAMHRRLCDSYVPARDYNTATDYSRMAERVRQGYCKPAVIR